MPRTADKHQRLSKPTLADCRQQALGLSAHFRGKPTIKPPEIVRAEANFLRFPLFALHTKGLRNRDGIECVGRKHIHGQVHEFHLSITRNTKHVYPGPLSRSAHFALLSIQQDRGFPYQNPITWESWRQLTDRMGLCHGGEIVAKIKNALRCTAGVLITSNYALTVAVGRERYLLPEDEHGYHLYDGYRFKNDLLDSGSVAKTNCVWLSEWYVANLNSLYSGPLHYATWLSLERESSIASRLYEFLLFNSKVSESVRIDYNTLANFLPVKPERYLSQAERQMASAFRLLRDHNVISDAIWTDGKRGQMQLLMPLGQRLRPASQPTPRADAIWLDAPADVEIREIRNTDTPAAIIVRKFHHLWSDNQNYRPTKSELGCANELMAAYGRHEIEQLLPKVIHAMRTEFPKAKSFGASRLYFTAAHDQHQKQLKRRQEQQKDALRREIDDRKASEAKQSRKRRSGELLAIWEGLSPDERSRIEQQSYERQPGKVLKRHFRENKAHRLRECLNELARQAYGDAA